ncbi:MAG: SurA N-terminal domain-containing protein [Holosporales bacterium]|jgi:parvulin-like peptidyl-prolyl isomerase|nr:SurA N-terminal domain-containing protein [Holosporales bacterium]
MMSVAVVSSGVFGKPRSKIGDPVPETTIIKGRKKKTTDANRNGSNVLSILKQINSRLCVGSQTSIGSATKDFFTVATVNGDDITNVDVINSMKLVFLFSGKPLDLLQARSMFKPIVIAMTEERLIQQYAKLLEIPADEAAVTERISEIAANNGVSVQKFMEDIRKLGISDKAFRDNIKNRILLSIVAHAFAEETNVSKAEIKAARTNAAREIRQKRYFLSEIIFRSNGGNDTTVALENARSVLALIKGGFNFSTIAETLSHEAHSGKNSNARWIGEDAVDPSLKQAILKLLPGFCSDIIKTNAGYKIACLLDVAESNRVGMMDGKFKILKSRFQYGGPLFTSSDGKKLDETLNRIKDVSSVDEYKKLGVAFEEVVFEKPNEYEMNQIMASKSSGQPIMYQSPDQENTIDVIMFVEVICGDAKIPDDEELKEKLVAEKFEKDFMNAFKRLKTTARIIINTENLKKVMQ